MRRRLKMHAAPTVAGRAGELGVLYLVRNSMSAGLGSTANVYGVAPRHRSAMVGAHEGRRNARVYGPVVQSKAGTDLYGCVLTDFEPYPW